MMAAPAFASNSNSNTNALKQVVAAIESTLRAAVTNGTMAPAVAENLIGVLYGGDDDAKARLIAKFRVALEAKQANKAVPMVKNRFKELPTFAVRTILCNRSPPPKLWNAVLWTTHLTLDVVAVDL